MKSADERCETHYLGWESPLLSNAAEFLRDQYALDGCFDLNDVICVLPTTSSVRRLASLLHRVASQMELEFWPPRIITTGELAEELHMAPGQIAMDFEQTLAWSDVLQAHHEETLAPLLPTLPPRESVNAWLELAGTLRRLHSELAADLLTFGKVAEHAETEPEKRRWSLLSQLHESYISTLADAGLVDPHAARLEAINNQACKSDRRIVLVGTSDLSELLVEMLKQAGNNVTALIAAPEQESFRFDEFGVVDTAAWMEHQLPLDDDQLISAGDVSDQSAAAAETLSQFGENFAADQITVGVTDESQVGPVELELRGCGVPTYRHLGWTVGETAIGRLFNLAGNHLQRGTWQTLAALVRHANVYDFVGRELASASESNEKIKLDWLAELDAMLAAHFPLSVDVPLPAQAAKDFPTAVEVASIVNRLFAPFDTLPQSISQWCESIGHWLTALMGKPPAEESSDRTRTDKACSAVRGLLNQFVGLNETLDVNVSGAVAFETLANRLGELRVSDSPKPDDIEILGWLDLALDDAPALVVMGLNHPFVPAAVTSDPFLPGALRTELRMADNDRRYARDVYAMHLLLTARKDVRFIVGQNAADGSPTPPSRLLAAAEPVDSARRVRQLLQGKRTQVHVQHRWDSPITQSELPVPKLEELDTALPYMSVTAFHDYLICPYRFYLRHVLRIRPVDDATGELAANQFGDLVHGSLEWYGESDDKSLEDPAKIEKAMLDHLHRYADATYGTGAASAVKLQVKQAERRLKFVAEEQAKRIAEGWVIEKTEASVRETATETSAAAQVTVDGQSMGIRGRFDRIDHHPDTGRWAILDYKTHGHKPEKKHLRRKDGAYEWIDLQLPLYRMMIPFLGIDPGADVQLGYFNVSEKPEETRINIAEFSDAQFTAADQLIHQIIRNIRANKFEPTPDRVQYDDYDMILQTRVPQRLLNQVEESEEAALLGDWA